MIEETEPLNKRLFQSSINEHINGTQLVLSSIFN